MNKRKITTTRNTTQRSISEKGTEKSNARRSFNSIDLTLARLQLHDSRLKTRAAMLELDFERTWTESERLRTWKTKRDLSRISCRSSYSDKRVIEQIVNGNDKFTSLPSPSERKSKGKVFLPSISPGESVCRRQPLAPERAVSYRQSPHIFYWG